MSTQNQQGYIALITVLIVGAACLATALALLTNGTDSQRFDGIARQSMQARNLSNACAEEALQKLNESLSYTGSATLTLGQGTCSYTVTNTGGNNRTIITAGNVASVVRKNKLFATINTSTISVTSWQEISD